MLVFVVKKNKKKLQYLWYFFMSQDLWIFIATELQSASGQKLDPLIWTLKL